MFDTNNYVVENCIICKEKFNNTNRRLIKESCGHIKCCQCLVQECNGCSQCQTLKGNTNPKITDETKILTITTSSSCKIKTEWAKLSSFPLHRPDVVEKEPNIFYDVAKVTCGNLNFDLNDDVEVEEEDEDKLHIDTNSDKSEDNENFQGSKNENEKRPKNQVIEVTSVKKLKTRTKSKSTSINHIIVKNNKNGVYFECTKCNKTFTSRSNRNYHLFCGSSEKPLKCDKCDKSFVTKFHYNYHLETHLLKDLYECNECRKKFLRKTSLRKHILKHTQEFQFICSECGLKFQSKGQMKIHENKHKNIYPYRCNKCNRGFTLKTNLTNHEIIHTGIKKFNCDKCNKKFPRKNALRLHMLTHSQLRPFFCNHCSKTFADKRIFERHKNIHTETKKYNCPKCETKCSRQDNFRRHLRNIHPDLNIIEILKERESSGDNGASNDIKKNECMEINEMPPKIDKSINIKDGPNTVNVIQFAGNMKSKIVPCSSNELKNEKNIKNTVHTSEIKTRTKTNSCEMKHVDISDLDPISRQRSYSNIEIYRRILSPYSKLYEAEEPFLNKPTNLRPVSVCQEIVKDKSSNYQPDKHFISPLSKKLNSNVKSKKNFNPIEIYRKILMPSIDDEYITNFSDKNELQETQKVNENIDEKNQNCVPKDFTEVHWRKRTSSSFIQK